MYFIFSGLPHANPAQSDFTLTSTFKARGTNIVKCAMVKPCFRAINPYPWNSSIQNDIKLLFSDRNKQSVCKSQVHYQHVEMFTQIVENHMLFVCSVHRLIVGTKSFFELAHPNKCGVFQSDSGTPSHHGFQHQKGLTIEMIWGSPVT